MKNFLLLKCGSSRYFSGSLAVFMNAAKLKLNFWGLAISPREARGEMRPNYFQYTQPPRKSQCLAPPLAGLGNQIERDFGLKNQLAVLFELNSK